MEQKLQLESRVFESGIAFTLKGDLDKAAEQVLKSAFDWEQGPVEQRRYLVLDLHQVGYINSAGMALLIRIARAGRKLGYHTFACGVSTHYQKLFRMVGLTEYLMLYPDEYAVLQRIEALEGEA
ncbi:anti-anti-sigma factor [Paenibacillus darwinianus]|uniref:Anti-anti-sigma factor n=1 Tax=Paenibacillus darwinianus TaxID=1380763 RepID=A0A9W5S2F0_9BACL|nr:STAS domain-containing protein [Paenibacillus darwinianus]EXX88319.1 anti-anti-sigma factor [Paenibacillus darwinianus]EXX89061.1 anti-anti-sigma factor [Paenibacillus darwinianus]EXX89337.1 anti-anti-sigma factor [Paenibacillus darwinianus]